MKVLLINGSPHTNGTTFRALTEVAISLNENGIETEIICVGNLPIRGCLACGACREAGKCVQKDDIVDSIRNKIMQADGLVVGSPVYYASINGTLKCLLDRVFYSGKGFEHKPAAAVTVARRAGTTSAFDIINKYFTINQMPVVSSRYWNNVFGSNSQQAELDKEGMQVMKVLGNNMAFLIKCIDAGVKSGLTPPEIEKAERTNFIR